MRQPATVSEAGDRSSILQAFGATPRQCDELLRYGDGGFRAPPEGLPSAYPLPDEPFVMAWDRYAEEAKERGVWATLREKLVQLRFPVESGISSSPEYLLATRRGIVPPHGRDRELQLRNPSLLRLFIHPTPAGRIPVLVALDRSDFTCLVQSLTRRNEPEPIPEAMGACVVAGYNNWDRVAQLRERWLTLNPASPTRSWPATFRQLITQKELYQDRFIILSTGPYSGVTAGSLGLDLANEDALALTLRLEHECAHYYCRRVWGSMRNSVLDEIIADFVGLLAATGRFRAEWMLRFLGLESYPRYRDGARLQHYLGTPRLSAGSVKVLQRIVVAAAGNLERYASQIRLEPEDLTWKQSVLSTLPQLSLESIAACRPEDWHLASHTSRFSISVDKTAALGMLGER